MTTNSLSDSIFKAVDDIINVFITKVSDKYKIDENELFDMWKNGTSTNSIIISPVVKDVKAKVSNADSGKKNVLSKLSKSELVTMCKSKGLKVSGTKEGIIERILENETVNISTPTKTSPKKAGGSPQIVKKLAEKIPVITITKNNFGNFEHDETGFVFDNKTQKVYGKQNKNGTISSLQHSDIDLCNKFKFDFVIPNNLNSKSGDAELELDDDDMLDVDDELDEDEEELEEEVEELEEVEYDEEY